MALGAPGADVCCGAARARSAGALGVAAWDEFTLSADEFYEAGDTVVVLGHTDVKKGDQSAQVPVVHIWRFRATKRSAGFRS